jgi:hypothetical protein
MTSQATILDFYTLVPTPGTPVVLGATTLKFNRLTISGWKSANVMNLGDVKWRPVGGVGWNTISPGQDYPIPIMDQTFLRASQIEIDAAQAGDGVHASYLSAIVYEGP